MELWKKPTIVKRTVIAAIIAAALMGGYTYSHRGHSPIAAAFATSNEVTAVADPARKFSALPDFAEIAAQQGPAVVNISVAGTTKTGFSGFPGVPQVKPGDPFYEFFRRFQMPTPQESVPTRGMGSGFIVSSDGTVLTNAHMVADADEVTVKLIDKREFKTSVVGLDKDIARSVELPPLVTDRAPGATAKLELWHKGKAKEISMSVGELKTADAKGK